MQPGRAREVVTRWVSASPVTRVGGPVAALLLGVSGLFGGLDRVPLAERVSEIKPGTEITVEPFSLTVKRAVAVDEIDGEITPLTPGNHLMVVLLAAENVSADSVSTHQLSPVSRAKSYLNTTLVVLDDRLAPETSDVYDADSNVAVFLLSPGLTYDLAVVWEFSGAVPEKLPLGLAKLTLRGETISPEVLAWQDPEEAATVTLPVTDSTKGGSP
jgi:hypothetical protein